MRIAQAAYSLLLVDPLNWGVDWAWGLPLIVVTVLIHVFGLGLIRQSTNRFSSRSWQRRHPTAAFVMVMGGTTLLATSLHGIEAGIWSVAYWRLGALPDHKSAMLYSLNAITSYGHTSLNLAQHWHLLGALEALNGWLLFGLTTAFLFGTLEKVWQFDRGGGQR